MIIDHVNQHAQATRHFITCSRMYMKVCVVAWTYNMMNAMLTQHIKKIKQACETTSSDTSIVHEDHFTCFASLNMTS